MNHSDLKLLRLSAGVTQENLAIISGITLNKIRDIETGKKKADNYEKFKLKKALFAKKVSNGK